MPSFFLRCTFSLETVAVITAFSLRVSLVTTSCPPENRKEKNLTESFKMMPGRRRQAKSRNFKVFKGAMEELSAGASAPTFLLESLVACSGRCSVLTVGQGPMSRAPAVCIAIAARMLLLLLLLLSID